MKSPIRIDHIAFLLILLISSPITGQEQIDKEHEKSFNIEELSWMVGSWKGDGFGGVSEEMWAPSAYGTMMGMYRHLQDGKMVFYEFLLLDKDGMRLKHFHPDLKGWETKDEMVTFPMVSVEEGKLSLKGLTFEKAGTDQMIIRLRMKRGDQIETEVFTMNRVD